MGICFSKGATDDREYFSNPGFEYRTGASQGSIDSSSAPRAAGRISHVMCMRNASDGGSVASSLTRSGSEVSDLTEPDWGAEIY